MSQSFSNGAWLASCLLAALKGEEIAKSSNSLLALTNKNLLLERVPPTREVLLLTEILSMHIGPHGICLQFYPRNFQVFTHPIATSELLHTLTSFKGHQSQKESNLAKYGTLIATLL